MTATSTLFTPDPAAWTAYEAFRPRSAGTKATNAANYAATVLLYLPLDPTQTALLGYYGQRLTALAHAAPPGRVPQWKAWDDQHHQLVLDCHQETLRCLMVALLVGRNINPDKIAPDDYPGLAAIALANSQNGH